MKKILSYLMAMALLGSSCKSVKNIFANKTPHEKYADKLEDRHLDETPEGRQWLAVSKRALEDPQPIQLPYRQNGYFHADRAGALALEFNADFGERITFDLAKKTMNRFVIFADLFKQDEKTTRLLSADTSANQFSFEVNETGTYILRLQPQLFNSGDYSLSISVGPSLGFPVLGSKASVGSYWGDNRDAGKRSHEGIDIFAPKLTPAVAGADGVVTGVKEGGLGGKTVWLRIKDGNTFLYYAHLDKQLVQEGQSVKQGEVVGLVGNTGNAKHTPSHLHFGVYTSEGPVNPLPFVNRTIKTAPAVAVKNLSGSLKLLKAQKTAQGVLVKANTELLPLAVNAKGYLAELPDGNIIQTPFTAVKVLPQPIRQQAQKLASVATIK
ncbi:M23 family metallopeptidase [Segetibacter sp.]|jgi:murein DD-endopeptidase MepM/ murein hydrolase activator NlpD|uniref:M23 family metallopeptidase n=1 Tax=Segetibacter sp. TaxID=2231182 RepID=UPI002616E1B3|nr:M23 family metallopeptidase [Segetibacter sp.]MCW3079779.1 Murein DD-endopeptidase MepM and murein hydrolase activator NlpD, containing LysM domain [Segetibacter sp.]